MKETIWKFELETTDNQFIEIPKGAQLLAVQTQSDKPCLWALVDPNAEKEKRCFEVFGTGHVINSNNREYIGTYQLNGGNLVFHVFEYTGVWTKNTFK